jgi:hypothetical protein
MTGSRIGSWADAISEDRTELISRPSDSDFTARKPGLKKKIESISALAKKRLRPRDRQFWTFQQAPLVSQKLFPEKLGGAEKTVIFHKLILSRPSKDNRADHFSRAEPILASILALMIALLSSDLF